MGIASARRNRLFAELFTPKLVTMLREGYGGKVLRADAGRSIAIYRISGAVFFGSAASLGLALDRILAGKKKFILNFAAAAFIDSSGALPIRGFVDKARRLSVEVVRLLDADQTGTGPRRGRAASRKLCGVNRRRVVAR